MAVQAKETGGSGRKKGSSACEFLRFLAARTWNDIREGEEAEIRIGEESITDRLLLDLARAFPLPSWVRKWNRYEEGNRTGADFDWWFVDPVRVRAVGLRVQAKRIDYFNQEFSGLGYRNKQGEQLAMLRRSAGNEGKHPLYLFYVASSTTRLGATACGSFESGEAPPGWAGAPNELYGCSLVAPDVIEAAVTEKEQDLAYFWPSLLPWSCLACCEAVNGDLVERVDLQVRRAGLLSQGEDGELPESLITDEVPPEVWAVIGSEDRDDFISPPGVGATLVTLVAPEGSEPERF